SVGGRGHGQGRWRAPVFQHFQTGTPGQPRGLGAVPSTSLPLLLAKQKPALEKQHGRTLRCTPRQDGPGSRNAPVLSALLRGTSAARWPGLSPFHAPAVDQPLQACATFLLRPWTVQPGTSPSRRFRVAPCSHAAVRVGLPRDASQKSLPSKRRPKVSNW